MRKSSSAERAGERNVRFVRAEDAHPQGYRVAPHPFESVESWDLAPEMEHSVGILSITYPTGCCRRSRTCWMKNVCNSRTPEKMWPTMEHSKLENMFFFLDCYTSKLPQHSGQRETWLKFRYCTKVSMVARVWKMWNVKNTREKRVMKSIFDWNIYTPYSCDAETIFMDFLSMQTTCSTQSPSSMSHHVSSSNTLSSFLEFYLSCFLDVWCLMGLFWVCCAELGSAYVGVSGPQWEGHKREDRQIIRSVDARETEVAGHFLLGLSSVPARCVFVVLLCFCVCVCQSLLFSFLTISAHSRGHTGNWMAWATEDPSKLLWKCPCFMTWWWNNA